MPFQVKIPKSKIFLSSLFFGVFFKYLNVLRLCSVVQKLHSRASVPSTALSLLGPLFCAFALPQVHGHKFQGPSALDCLESVNEPFDLKLVQEGITVFASFSASTPDTAE